MTYLDFNPGPIDGLRGRMTRGAISDFQKRKRIAVTDELDEHTMDQLMREAFPG